MNKGSVTYSYVIPGRECKTTIWLNENEYATDVYEPGDYIEGDALYCGIDGVRLTTKVNGKIVGYVTGLAQGYLKFNLGQTK